MVETTVDQVEPGVCVVPPTMDLAEFAAPAGLIDRALADLATHLPSAVASSFVGA